MTQNHFNSIRTRRSAALHCSRNLQKVILDKRSAIRNPGFIAGPRIKCGVTRPGIYAEFDTCAALHGFDEGSELLH